MSEVKKIQPPKDAPVRPKLTDDVEKAKAAQAVRLATPAASVTNADEIPVKQLIRRVAPECVTQIVDGVKVEPEWHDFTGGPRKHEVYIAEGYEPIIEKGTGQQVTHEGCPIYKLPMELHKRNVDLVSNRSKRRVQPTKVANKGESGVVETELTSMPLSQV